MNTRDLIKAECREIEKLLLEKNESYGDSAANPVNIFSELDSIEGIKVRIDDKLKRIKYGRNYAKEDTELDLIGYLILLRIERKQSAKSE